MKLTFVYNRNNDIGCLLTYGKTSMNSPTQTNVYEELVKDYGDTPSEADTDTFIEIYLGKNKIDTERYGQQYQGEWNKIADAYQQRTEKIFGVKLEHDITAYLTVNPRCPYNIRENMFFVSMPTYSASKTAMHELWHFYTWYRFGKEWEQKLGAKRYNDIKEALTVLLNVECKDLLPEGMTDKGYPQHKDLREKILELWNETKDIEKVWTTLA